MKIRVQRLHPAATLPEYATGGAAGFDLRAVAVHPGPPDDHGRSVVCDTGLAMEIPPGWVLLLFSRSGHGFKHGIRLANCVGVIDSDYRGEIRVKLTSDRSTGFHLALDLDRVAQGVLMQAPIAQFEEVDQLSTTERGTGGFGSTGNG